MEIAKLISANIEVAAKRLSENMIFIKHLERNSPDLIIITNNSIGKKLGYSDKGWNLYFENKTHWIAMSISAEEFKKASKNLKNGNKTQ